MRMPRNPRAGYLPYLVLIASLLMYGCASETAGTDTNKTNANQTAAQSNSAVSAIEVVDLKIPASIQAEHEELHEMLENVVKLGGKTGEAGKRVDEVLSPHFKHEDEFALPQLGLLRDLADRKNISSAKAVQLSERLRADMPKMMEEHKAIVKALDELSEAAKAENKPLGAEFAEKLKAHAVTEEEILYPAALLIGDTLKRQK